jgi:uncharacterized protein YdeI (YjbR/CyaY-like superfamily)
MKAQPEVRLPELELRSRQAWRKWLQRHHASSPGVWLVFHKQQTGVESIPYDDAVREALCHGWIDSLVKRLDAGRYARKFTPRRPGSAWSASNVKRWAELDAAGELAAAGRAASPEGAPRATPPSRAEIPELPDYIRAALERHPGAWTFFQRLPPGERRRLVGWIHVAKKPETRERRIGEAVALLAKGERLGLK